MSVTGPSPLLISPPDSVTRAPAALGASRALSTRAPERAASWPSSISACISGGGGGAGGWSLVSRITKRIAGVSQHLVPVPDPHPPGPPRAGNGPGNLPVGGEREASPVDPV